MDPHAAERLILIGCHDAAARPHALRLLLDPKTPERWLEQARDWLNDTVKYDSTTCAVFVQPEYQTLPETQVIVQLVAEHYKQARINQNTVEAIGANQGRNFIANLRRLAQSDGYMRDVRSGLRMMTGETAIIVGAGPSLDQSADLVAAHHGPIIGVNTSAGALAQHGVRAHVIVCTESKPVPEGIARINSGQLAMDLIGHPANWRSSGDNDLPPDLVFVGTEPNLARYAERLGLLPLAYGASCTTAAVSLAFAMGAERIALVGQDCSFMTDPMAWPTEPGALPLPVVGARMYASGTPYEETLVAINTDTRCATIQKPTVGEYTVEALEVPAVQGGTTWTTHSMLSFAHWFRDQPEAVRARVMNCTPRGVYIDGIDHPPLAQVIRRSGDAYGNYHRYAAGRHANEKLVMRAQQLLRHMYNIGTHGAEIQNDAVLLEWTHRHPILQMWVAPERLRMRRMDELSTAERGQRVAHVTRLACREIAAIAKGDE